MSLFWRERMKTRKLLELAFFNAAMIFLKFGFWPAALFLNRVGNMLGGKDEN